MSARETHKVTGTSVIQNGKTIATPPNWDNTQL